MRRTLCTVALLAFLLSSCVPPQLQPAKDLRDAVQPEHMRYVEADTSLTPAQKARRARTWEAFDVWIEAAEVAK